jgi:UDP:flavonoid glycosyltransferase YjiC (YdhE family)
MARFLMIPHAPGGTLAHLAACTAVATGLRARGHEPIFAYGGTRPELLDRAGMEWVPVLESRGPMSQDWFESPEDLERILGSQLDAISRLRPAACITSAGVGRLATEVARVPHLALMHTLAGSPYGRRAVRRWMVRDLARHPSRLAGHLRARERGRPSDGGLITGEVRRRLGLPPLDAGTASTGVADLVACTTTPTLDPAVGLPAHWRYVGPLSYGTGAGALPSRLEAPRAYVSQGSTGSDALLRRAVSELAEEGIEVVASTGGLCEPDELRALGATHAGAILDTRAELVAADVAVIGGGHLTAMEALQAATPTVVLPLTSGQSAAALRADRLGTGIGLWPRVGRGAIARAARRVLGRPRYRESSRRIAARIAAEWDGNARAAALAETLVERPGRDPAR